MARSAQSLDRMGPLFSIGLVAVVGALIFCGGIIAGRAIGWSFTKSALVAIAFSEMLLKFIYEFPAKVPPAPAA